MRFVELVSEAPVVPPTGTPPAIPGSTTLAPTQSVQADPAAQSKMLAQQAIDRANKKKEIQDQIKNKQKELADLQKQLALIK